MSIVAPSPTSVYRYYDADHILLYVGITSRATSRQREHNGDKEWWGFVNRQAVDHFETRAEASRREKALILKYRPPFNKQHNPDHEAVRAIYLVQASIDPEVRRDERRRVINDQMPKAARSMLGVVGHRLPLQLVNRDGAMAIYKTDAKHSCLVREVDWADQQILLRNPNSLAVLEDVRHQGSEAHLAFRFTRNGKAPSSAWLKLRTRKEPFGVYAYEAVVF